MKFKNQNLFNLNPNSANFAKTQTLTPKSQSRFPSPVAPFPLGASPPSHGSPAAASAAPPLSHPRPPPLSRDRPSARSRTRRAAPPSKSPRLHLTRHLAAVALAAALLLPPPPLPYKKPPGASLPPHPHHRLPHPPFPSSAGQEPPPPPPQTPPATPKKPPPKTLGKKLTWWILPAPAPLRRLPPSLAVVDAGTPPQPRHLAAPASPWPPQLSAVRRFGLKANAPPLPFRPFGLTQLGRLDPAGIRPWAAQ